MTSFLIAAFFIGALIFAAYALIVSWADYGDAVRRTLAGHDIMPRPAHLVISHRVQPAIAPIASQPVVKQVKSKTAFWALSETLAANDETIPAYPAAA